jgi:fatty acid desaturase
LEIHWAFYRGAAIRLFGDYYGVFFGLLLIFGEWWLSPDLRREQGAAHRRGETLTTAAMALTIAVIYYFTSNLWLCIGVHLGIQFGLLFFLATYCYDLADYEGQYQ